MKAFVNRIADEWKTATIAGSIWVYQAFDTAELPDHGIHYCIDQEACCDKQELTIHTIS